MILKLIRQCEGATIEFDKCKNKAVGHGCFKIYRALWV